MAKGQNKWQFKYIHFADIILLYSHQNEYIRIVICFILFQVALWFRK